MSQFYKKLKNDIKDDLYKEDRPRNLAEYIQYIIKIDDRNYIRYIEKHSQRPLTLK